MSGEIEKARRREFWSFVSCSHLSPHPRNVFNVQITIVRIRYDKANGYSIILDNEMEMRENRTAESHTQSGERTPSQRNEQSNTTPAAAPRPRGRGGGGGAGRGAQRRGGAGAPREGEAEPAPTRPRTGRRRGCASGAAAREPCATCVPSPVWVGRRCTRSRSVVPGRGIRLPGPPSAPLNRARPRSPVHVSQLRACTPTAAPRLGLSRRGA